MSTLPSPIPVTLLTGFLGSGKTTLLNRIIREMTHTAVIMNEFGEIGLDHQLLQKSEGPLALLSGGCVCCTVQGGLTPTLKNLYTAASNSEIPAFERVVIETTGIADPTPIINALINERWVAARFQLQGVVSTVDAVLGEQQLDSYDEALKQVAVADRLILTKTDLANAAQMETITAIVNGLNPGATLLTAVQGEIDASLLLDASPYNPAAKSPEVAQWLREARFRPAGQAAPSLAANHPATAHFDQRMRSTSMIFEQPLEWANLYRALKLLTERRSRQILRLKGILNLQGQEVPTVIHGVQHVIYPPSKLPAWPDADRRSRLVLITFDLDAATMDAMLQEFSQAITNGTAEEIS